MTTLTLVTSRGDVASPPTRSDVGRGVAAMGNYLQHMHWRGLAQGSIDHRLSVLRRCQTAIGKPIREATTEDLLRWLDSKRVSPRTRYGYISHLAAFFRWALLEGQIETDPTLRIPRPKLKMGVPRPISTDDVLFAVGAAPDATVRAMVVLAAYAGLRCMEIAQLDGSDVLDRVKPAAIVVENGKGGKSRVVPVGAVVVHSLLAVGFRSHGPVFREDGRPLPAWKVSHILRSHLYDCGIRASGHQLRHTYATQVLRASGGDLRMTQELLGHSSPTTTSIYAAWAQDKAADVVGRIYGAA